MATTCLNIHLESFWKPTAVTFPLCPSYACSGWLLGLLTSKILMLGLPAAARNCLSAVISSLFTCYSTVGA